MPDAAARSGAAAGPGGVGLSAGPVPVGALAPDFALEDQYGAPVRLSARLDRGPALVFFYPYAFSSVCGGELRGLREALPALTAAGVPALCVSCDAKYALRVYSDGEGFDGLSLLSDHWPHGRTAREYGVFDEARGIALRGSFLIQPGGAVAWTTLRPLSEPRPVDELLAAVAGLGRG